MENFNKNWLVILLAATVFGMLGFLLGRTTGQHGPVPIVRSQRHVDRDFAFERDDDDVEVTVKMDTVIKDGKQIIIKEIKKIKK